jgi:hypothetical protein
MKGETRTFAALSGFLIVAIITSVGLLSMLAGLSFLQFVLAAAGASVLIWTIFFTLFEFRRITRPSRGVEVEESPGAEIRIVIVEPPTGEPYPHHEQYVESPGQDQGQLTSRLPDSIPLFDLLRWRRRQRN